MKKIIALLLVAVMCLSFVACGNNAEKENTGNNAETNNTQVSNEKAEAEKTILGTWERDGDNGNVTITFNADHTCELVYPNMQIPYNWKYDVELDCYIITLSTHREDVFSSVNSCIIVNENNSSYLSYNREQYYRQDI